MINWEQLRDTIVAGASISPISTSACEIIRRQHAGIPEDYLLFLSEIGWGEFETLQLFSGPTPAPDIYGPRGHLGKIILIGDDYQGYCFGFAAPAGFAMVEITPAGEARFLNKSFVDFMLSRTTSTQ